MSQRRTTVPPTREHSRSSRSGRKGLIATEKTKKQSARKRTALDNRFHRTFFRSGARGLHVPIELPPEPVKREARKRRANERPRVACCEELGRDSIDNDFEWLSGVVGGHSPNDDKCSGRIHRVWDVIDPHSSAGLSSGETRAADNALYK